ncbi:MAG: hypothetical protein M1838_000376 [Thelocarpon superellum]|nr:MAG: hypothetical protein M1838_000376 [Thelocarpon superellum]
MNMLGEAGADQYVATPLSRAWTDPRLRDGISFCFDFHGPIQQGLPSYLAAHGFKDPDDAKDSVCAEALGSDAFTWIAKHPGLLEAFKNHMAGYHIGRPSWMDDGFYPVQDRLVHGFRAGSDAVMLVDVGGATGHDLQELKMKHPHLPGRCVLQDQPAVIAQITRPPDGIEPMSHDFFTPQPVLGARAYFLHSVLHDWNDDKCRKILSQLVPAMTKGYSKILIHENVVPDEGAHWGMTSLDLLMMGVASARERPARQWHELVASVGLKISGIWTKDSACESLIECVWADDP